MRRFYVKAFDEVGRPIMTPIQVIVPDGLPLETTVQTFGGDQRRAMHQAVQFVTGVVASEFVNYAASECLLSPEPK